jgi:hypothetical protein
MAGRCLDSYPPAAKVDAYVPLVMAHLRGLGKRGVPDAMRPFAVTLTAPAEMDGPPVVAALDTWSDMVACNGGGSSALLVEGQGHRKGTRHWHGLVLTWEPERTLAAWWCQQMHGASRQAQRITSISTSCLPLGDPGMERDVRRVLEYAFRQHDGSEIVARGGLGTCWFQATVPAADAEVLPSSAGSTEIADDVVGQERVVRASAKREPTKRTTGARTAEGRNCEYCGGSLEGLRRGALYCCKSCRNMASRKRAKDPGKAA